MQADIENLREIFTRMATDGFDLASPLKWGFFFIDPIKENLLKVNAELREHGYHLEELHESDDGNWVLQVSKIEILSCEKLHHRNVAFNELAEYCDVVLYDGWDVGRVEI